MWVERKSGVEMCGSLYLRCGNVWEFIRVCDVWWNDYLRWSSVECVVVYDDSVVRVVNEFMVFIKVVVVYGELVGVRVVYE